MAQEKRSPRLSELPPPPHDKTGWPWTEEGPCLPETMPDGSPWPRISIVTPSYNQGQFIEETIRSVLLQGYSNLEYIVIDGGSTDDSVEIIKEYKPWIAYWVSERDAGQSQAINRGFEHAKGDILAWLNSDDLYAPGALQRVGALLAGKEKALLVGSSIQVDGDDLRQGVVDDKKPTWGEMVYEARTFSQPSVFWMRDLWLEAGPLREQLYFVMDYYLWLQMRPKAKEELFLKEALSITHIHPEQKGKRAERGGKLRQFARERAFASILAAKQRGELPLAWYVRARMFRIRRAWNLKNPRLLRKSAFLDEALSQVLKGNVQ